MKNLWLMVAFTLSIGAYLGALGMQWQMEKLLRAISLVPFDSITFNIGTSPFCSMSNETYEALVPSFCEMAEAYENPPEPTLENYDR